MAKLTDVAGIGPVIAKVLSAHNIRTVEELASITMSELLKVPGFSDIRARTTIKSAANCLQKENRLKPASVTDNTQTTVKKIASNKTIINTAVDQPKKDKADDKKKNKKDDKKKNKKEDKKKGTDKKKKGKGKKKS